MPDEVLGLRARIAGLALALERFPDDVAAAADQADGLRKALAAPLSPADEPWSPARPEPPR